MKKIVIVAIAVALVALLLCIVYVYRPQCQYSRDPNTPLFNQAFGDDAGYPSLIDGELLYKYDKHRLTGNKNVEGFCTGDKCPYCD